MGSEQARFDGLVSNIREARLPSPEERHQTRVDAKVSIREGAGALHVSPMTYLRWERGEVEPRRREHAIAYAEFLAALREAVA
jgi:DNA-binding transcriptional regulator YiaG